MAVYEGNENYLFISYAHKDSKAVMNVVDELISRGYRVWYDEGIAPGSEWPENIAQHLNDSAAVIAFVTPNSIASDNCRREVHFALSHKKPFLSVYLEKTDLSPGMELQLAAQQSVLRYNYQSERIFIEKICACSHVTPCLKQPESPALKVEQPPAPVNPEQLSQNKVDRIVNNILKGLMISFLSLVGVNLIILIVALIFG